MAKPTDTFFELVDQDKLLSRVLPIINNALVAWQRGTNADEGSLMNQITSAINASRARRCDIGINGSLRVETDLFNLHRQGVGTTDRYGSDLAVTVRSSGEHEFVKTSFIQFKIARGTKVVLESRQRDDAASYEEVAGRAFCVAVEPTNRTIRVQPINKLRYPEGERNASQTFDTSRWSNFGDWLIAWLSCTVGLHSTAEDQRSIESLLERYRLEDSTAFAGEWNLQPDFYPAKSWLSIKVKR